MWHLQKLSQGSSGNQKVLKAAIFSSVRLLHNGIAETGQRKYPPFLPIRLFPLLNNIASGSLSATAELLVFSWFSCKSMRPNIADCCLAENCFVTFQNRKCYICASLTWMFLKHYFSAQLRLWHIRLSAWVSELLIIHAFSECEFTGPTKGLNLKLCMHRACDTWSMPPGFHWKNVVNNKKLENKTNVM